MIYDIAFGIRTASTFRFAWISALAVYTSLGTVTIFVTSASNQTTTANTSLTRIALAVT